MKYFYCLCVSIMIPFASYAQIEFNPNMLLLEINEGEKSVNFNMSAINNFQEPQSLYWTFEEGENFPEEWTVSIKDNNLCYPEGDYDCHPLFPNSLVPGDSIRFIIRVLPEYVAGSTYGKICIYTDSMFTNKIASSAFPINTVENTEDIDLVLFPNPVIDIFSLQNDSEVKTLEILNHGGSLVKRANHFPGQTHSTIDLQTGSYILVLRNESKDIIKTLNLFKE